MYGFKMCAAANNTMVLVTLKITGLTTDKKDINPKTHQFRCSSAFVEDIEGGHKEAYSMYDPTFKYIKGEQVVERHFDRDINNVYSAGIHYFRTKHQARGYGFCLDMCTCAKCGHLIAGAMVLNSKTGREYHKNCSDWDSEWSWTS